MFSVATYVLSCTKTIAASVQGIYIFQRDAILQYYSNRPKI